MIDDNMEKKLELNGCTEKLDPVEHLNVKYMSGQ